MSSTLHQQSRQYETIARAIEYIRAHAREQPSLAEIAQAVNLSEHHLQRIFTEWAGISPKRFLQFLTKEHAKQALNQSKDVLTTTLEAGLSSPGRLHDLMVTCEAMTPGEIRSHGKGISITYGIAETPFGQALIGWTTRGICYLAFCENNCLSQEKDLFAQWPEAVFARKDSYAEKMSGQIFSEKSENQKLHLLLNGTNFQIKVWEALLNIAPSELVSYDTLAKLAGSPAALRAVGSAMAANKIAYLIPCHRVIRKEGSFGNYRWGNERKLAIHAWEAARQANE
ncbi:MAG: methylated-DNA--[protein]-cysteine S-methyltransferase [Gammaproteobacteria bacterium]|nr:methylated-DNA--[protein]-cysteine S-methyltransferase [Gammaproteobacteria bacterium]